MGSNLNEFKNTALLDFSKKICNSSITKSSELVESIGDTKKFDVIYPFVGETLDFLMSLEEEHNLDLSFIVRELDQFAWQFANKGFFNFKKNLRQIIDQL